MAHAHVRTVIMNSEDPERLAAFWGAVLGVEVRERDADAGIVWLHPDQPGGTNVGFQQVARRAPEGTETHLDVAVDEMDAAQTRIEGLGGTLRTANRLENGFEWRVMVDPDGNPFCIYVE
ncbi:MAG: hypothetical protein M9961_00295 [Ilumatobacteraceae bacterium]|nr:hypothetical protein [Ilumatobacteraceae bacterium]